MLCTSKVLGIEEFSAWYILPYLALVLYTIRDSQNPRPVAKKIARRCFAALGGQAPTTTGRLHRRSEDHIFRVQRVHRPEVNGGERRQQRNPK